MDKNTSGKEACDDKTRESLIAISYHLPENDSAQNPSPPKVTNGTHQPADDRAEMYRAQLISISYPETEVKDVPARPGGF